ncbi:MULTISPECIES: glycoside hydrolase family 26 protein [unclassified Fibrobacter]|uniref:glycoside hydrolase family 26 protein n=1 Tax=unclassified Fibrobacter TaxID=2634177 RepID=UPI0025BE82DD|nr:MULTISPECIES: glycosyl hydrolase [unclassified Fibrobacter]
MQKEFRIGAWVGGNELHPQPTKENIQAFQALQGRNVDLVSLFALFDINTWNWVEPFAETARENGSTLVVTWMPNGYNARRINEGEADSFIRHFAKSAKEYGHKIWLRPLHEANGDWYDWGVGKQGAGNTDENVAEAFRHIVRIFREESVGNVKWVWTTNSSNVGENTTFTGTYPGDDFVDYISIDGYNWGDKKCWSRWKSFSEVFRKSYNALAGIDKPIFIAETSCTESGGNKAEWIADMFKVLPVEFPRIFAIMWFNQSKSFEADWALDTSSAAVDAWKAGLNAPHRAITSR